MPGRHRRKSAIQPSESPAIVQLWALRILLHCGGIREFHRNYLFEGLGEFLGLDDWIDEDDPPAPAALRTELKRRLTAAERGSKKIPMPRCLATNVARIAELVALSGTDCRILEFVVLLQSDQQFAGMADILGMLSPQRTLHVLAVVIDLPQAAVREALAAHGVLARSGLMTMDRSTFTPLSGKFELLSDRFADAVASSDADPLTLLRDIVVPGPSPVLTLADYSHLAPALAILRPYLHQALAKRQQGVNVLMYGSPGTGKTQLSRVLAQNLSCELFEVATEDDQGDPLSGKPRLRAFRAAQSFLAQRRALLLFDEVEDVFLDLEGYQGVNLAQGRKGWLNRMLESNPVPTFWLSNSIGGIDAALLRRFDLIVELPVPPRRQREHILRGLCFGLLDTCEVRRIAESEVLAPALVSRAASVVRAVQGEIAPMEPAAALAHLIDSTLRAQGHPQVVAETPNHLSEIYDPKFVQANTDLHALATGLAQSRSGRLCLYGPPGTGKSAFGHWLAETLAMPLLVRRASDLLSMWLGRTEQQIAEAFRQAEADGALLLIDEVDGFLQDRRNAARSWEVTQVNEMLTQMEAFGGVFIASTNLQDGLDAAALRRFDLKVAFDYLCAEQGWALLQRHALTLGLARPGHREQTRLANLHNLTPGDFATVHRQARFRPMTSAMALIAALEAECHAKEGHRAAPGFLTP